MEILPPTMFNQLLLVTGAVIQLDEPVPGGQPDEKVWCIFFVPAEEVTFGESEGETTPASYQVLMRGTDGKLSPQGVPLYQVPADKVLMAARRVSVEECSEMLAAAFEKESMDLSGMVRSNGQTAAATAAP